MSGRGIGPVQVVPLTRANARRLLSRGAGDALAAVARDAIDSSPFAQVFRFPLRPGAILRTWRNYREEHAAIMTEPRRGALLRAFDAARGRWLAGGRSWRIVEPARAAKALADLDAVPCGRFEVPRDLERIADSLTAERDGLWSVVLEPNGGSSRRVATVYVRTERVRLPLSRRCLHYRDGHVSEIFPPVTDVAVATGIVRALVAQAVRRGLGCLSVHAMTSPLRSACAGLGAERRWARTIAIHPGAAPPSLAEALVDPASWWCRAFCEEQIEETGSMSPWRSAAVPGDGPMLACVAGREAPEQR